MTLQCLYCGRTAVEKFIDVVSLSSTSTLTMVFEPILLITWPLPNWTTSEYLIWKWMKNTLIFACQLIGDLCSNCCCYWTLIHWSEQSFCCCCFSHKKNRILILFSFTNNKYFYENLLFLHLHTYEAGIVAKIAFEWTGISLEYSSPELTAFTAYLILTY